MDTRGASVRFPAASRRATTRRVSAASPRESLVVGEIHPAPSGASRRIHAGRVRAVNAACALSAHVPGCLYRSFAVRALGESRSDPALELVRVPPQRDASPRAREGGVDVVGVAHACGLRDDERAEEVGAGLGEGNVAERDGAGVVRDEGGHARSWARQRMASAGRADARGAGGRSPAARMRSASRTRRTSSSAARALRASSRAWGRARRARGVRAARREGAKGDDATRAPRARATPQPPTPPPPRPRAPRRASLGRRARRVVRLGHGPSRARRGVPRDGAGRTRVGEAKRSPRATGRVGRAPRAAPRARVFATNA